MPDIDTTAISGVEARGYRRGALTTDPWDQYVIPVRDRIVSFQGRATTFVTPGRAAISQKLLALHNATGSTVLVGVSRIRVDLLTTVVKAATVLPPIVRLCKFTAVPTNGTALGKTGLDSSQTSNASVTAWGDSSADNSGAGTSSGTTLTITTGAVCAQTYASRYMGGAGTNPGYEPADTMDFVIANGELTLRALEGVCVFLDQATVTTGNPTTDKWIGTVDWEEYTRP